MIISVTIAIEDDINSISSMEPLSEPVNCEVVVNLILPLVFKTNSGSEPVPFLTISNTISNDADIEFLKSEFTSIDDVYWVMFVFLTNPLTFVINVGSSSTPSSKRLIMVENELLMFKL